MAESNLLFPSATGGLRSASVLDKPFREVTAKLVDKRLVSDKHLTPRAMRRTFKDLCRAAEVKDIVSRAISGHATEQMHRLYQTVGVTEVEQSIAKVISLAKAREVLVKGKGLCAGGAPGGAPDECKEKRSAGGDQN